MLNSLLKFWRGNKSSVACGDEHSVSHRAGLFSRLNTVSWLTAHCLFTGHANGAVRPCVDSCKWGIGWWECWGLGVGGWRMSLEPINSSLTKHLGEISHALLASCTENPLSGSPEMGIPYGHAGNTTQMKGIIWSLRRTS